MRLNRKLWSIDHQIYEICFKWMTKINGKNSEKIVLKMYEKNDNFDTIQHLFQQKSVLFEKK